ncbi:sensor histidine kinase [Bacillus dakarensis]|uniref:sensor histidine kinase n=1 Tax=Robertmurraya dakarensis TaxID=1926278 RepID=UPI000980DD52|nr:HAMP domain-containing sensor histidine kinase [Bacillus dakarensis]
MKLRNRINLYTAVLFIVLLILMNLFIFYLFSRLMINSELEQTKAETEKIVIGINEGINLVPPEDLLRAYVPIDGMIRIVLEDQKDPAPVTSPSEQDLMDRKVQYYKEERSERIQYNNRDYSFESIPIIWVDGQVANLQVTKSLKSVIENLNILRIVLIIVTVVAMIPVVISSRLLSNLITTPITSLINTMTEIQKSGQFKRIRIQGKSKDELVEMGNTFNHMIDILETNSEKQEQFVSNASHELKTPLTVIESYASLLKRRGKDEPKIFDEAVDAIHSEAIRMREMTEQLLLLARPNEKWTIQLQHLQLSKEVEQLVQTFQKGFDREIQLEIDNDVSVESDPQKLKQLLYIFLDNARKYSEETIFVTVGKKDEQAFIKISDRGIGIPKEDLPKIYDRFYRVDKARSRKQGGSGLGLSLAQELADSIGAEITIDSVEGIGTTVTVSLHQKDK